MRGQELDIHAIFGEGAAQSALALVFGRICVESSRFCILYHQDTLNQHPYPSTLCWVCLMRHVSSQRMLQPEDKVVEAEEQA